MGAVKWDAMLGKVINERRVASLVLLVFRRFMRCRFVVSLMSERSGEGCWRLKGGRWRAECLGATLYAHGLAR